MLTICIITKNEEKNIEKCLEKLVPLNYEIVVVDTGSTDQTKEIASRFTDKVFDFQWCNDFSIARNFAASKASNDYVLMVDSDEFLKEYISEKIKKLVSENPEKVGRIHRKNFFTQDGKTFSGNELVNRLYNRKLYRYEGKIHEQIAANTGGFYETYPLPLYFDHYGYEGTKEERKEKAERNIRMLKEFLKEQKDDPYILYQLGKGYYYAENYLEATKYFRKALEFDLDINLEYVIDMVEMYGYALINSNNVQEALLLANVYDEFSKSADFVFLMGLIYMQGERFKEAEQEFIKATKISFGKVEGVNSYLAWYNAGVIRECLGDKKKALEYYKQCGEYEPAKEGARRCESH